MIRDSAKILASRLRDVADEIGAIDGITGIAVVISGDKFLKLACSNSGDTSLDDGNFAGLCRSIGQSLTSNASD